MNALQLLETLTACGAVATVEGATLWIEPREVLTDELRAEIRANKPALLVLLQHGDRFAESSAPASPAPDAPAPETQPATPFRAVAPFLLVPANFAPAPGAAAICQVLQSFERVFAAAREKRLPTNPLEVGLCGEILDVESAAVACIEIEAAWTERARSCQKERRDLTPAEAMALEIAAEFLEGIGACWDGSQWRDLEKPRSGTRDNAAETAQDRTAQTETQNNDPEI